MLTAAIDGLVARYGLQGERIGEVAAGAVLKHSSDFNLTRESVLGSALSAETPAYDVQQACATGLETVVSLSNKIRLGPARVGDRRRRRHHVGRPDRRERPPAPRAARPVARQDRRAEARGRREDPPEGPRARRAPNTGEPRTHLSMGEHQALTTAQWGITQAAQDEVALASHQRLAAAYDAGFFDDLVTPFRGLTRDANLRADSSLEKLAKLKPAFGLGLDTPATMTAGNSTPLSDGASTVLLGSADWAAAHDLVAARVGRRRRGRCGRLRARRRRAAHGARVRGAAPARPQRADAGRLRLRRDPRGVRVDRADDAGRVGVRGVRARRGSGLDGAFGTVDRAQAQRARVVAGRGAPVRRDRRADRRDRQQGAAPPQGRVRLRQPVRALVSVCAAGGLGLTAILEAA